MPKVRFSEEDLKSGAKLETGWYKLRVTKATQGESKADKSITYPMSFVVVSGPDGVKSAGTPIRHWFSEKFLAPMTQFLACFITGGKIETDKEYEIEQTVGKEVMGYVHFDIERKNNVIDDFKTCS